MRPEIELDERIVAENARAWRRFVAPAKLYAVVKGNGYGWGVDRLVRAVEPFADAFCVSDVDELRDLRALTARPAIVFGSVTPEQRRLVQSLDAIATCETADDVRDAIAAGVPVRLGLRPAAAWSGNDAGELRAFAPILARARTPVQLWTHLVDADSMKAQVELFASVCQTFLREGVVLESTDVASTFPFAAGCRGADAVRIGIGLFGASGGTRVDGVRCALRVRGPIVRDRTYAAGTRVGYGPAALESAQRVVTARCGYADGVPKTLEGRFGIRSVGMQYVTVDAAYAAAPQFTVLDESSDLDAFAAACARLPHEIVTALGNASG